MLGVAGLATASLALPEAAVQAQEAARRGRPPLKITDVKTILTQPGGEHLVVVKVLTSEPGLYGVGCATHGERPLAVAAAIDQHVKPLLIGKDCDRIEDIWQTSYVASYFRSGVTLNNALSGIDGALWDILGKQAGLPVYKLLGGKVREAVPLYAHASAEELPALEDQVRKWQAQGYRHVRVQLAVPGYATYGAAGETSEDVQQARPAGIGPSPVFEPTPYVNNTIKMFEHLRAKLGLRRRAAPRRPRARARRPRPSSSRRPWSRTGCSSSRTPSRPRTRPGSSTSAPQTSTPLAMGELFVNRHEWLPLVTNRWIDFIRLHISAVGGLSMARKVAACCEFFNVRTAWHGPGNVSPVGHAVNLHLDLASYNFGIQEQHLFSDTLRELFPGAPEIKGGYMYSNDKPGLGIDIDEKVAARFPYTSPGRNRGTDRRLDGTIVRP